MNLGGLGAVYPGMLQADNQFAQSQSNLVKMRQDKAMEIGRAAYGNALQELFKGDAAGGMAPPTVSPGQQSQPMNGPAQGGGMPPPGGPQMQGGGGMPQRPPMQQPQPGGGAPQQQGSQQLDWRRIVQAITQKNPGLKGPELAAAVDSFMPLMTQQSKIEWQQASLQLKQETIDSREKMLDTREKGLGERLERRESSLDSRNERTNATRLETTRMSTEARRDIANLNAATRQEIEDKRQAGKLQWSEMSTAARRDIAKMNDDTRRELFGTAEEGRNSRSEANRTQRGEQFDRREKRLGEALDFRKDQGVQRLDLQKQSLEQRMKAGNDKNAVTQWRQIVDAQHKMVMEKIATHSLNNNLKPEERKALDAQEKQFYEGEIKRMRGGGTAAPGSSAATAPKDQGQAPATIPPEAVQVLKEGQVTTFENGQKWTLKGGKPEQVP